MNRCTFSIVFVLLMSILALGCDNGLTVHYTDPVETRFSQVADTSFAVGDSTVLVVINFTGEVKVHPGDVDIMRIVTTEWAKLEADLGKTEFDISTVADTVFISTSNPAGVSDASVDLDITVPPTTRPNIDNHVGATSYVGRAEGECRFETGVGSLLLTLPEDVNVGVELSAGVGTVFVGFTVDGHVSQNVVTGNIGTGLDGTITARVGVGTISVIGQ